MTRGDLGLLLILMFGAFAAVITVGYIHTSSPQTAAPGGSMADMRASARSAAPAAAARSGGPSQAEILARVAELEQRLAASGGAVAEWKMLGRSYMALGRHGAAAGAWSQVSRLAPGDAEAAGALRRLADIASQGGRHPAGTNAPGP